MEIINQSFFEEFILVGFSHDKNMCALFFTTLLIMYIITVFGNIFVIGTVILYSKLHLPMYFFLCNLSFIDLCFSSNNLPKAMVDVLSKKRSISVMGCMVQMNVGLYLGGTESILLAVMAYDRYVAVRFPLHYTSIMDWKTCQQITFIMCFVSFILLIVLTSLRPMSFCIENRIDHFVCEKLAVLELSCENGLFLKVSLLIVSLFTLVTPLVFIVVSYILIISSILTIRSTNGRTKAFSTCASHLIVVSMFYGTTITIYTLQTRDSSLNMKYVSMVYGIVIPALNPLIYTLRNNDVKKAFWQIITKVSSRVILFSLELEFQRP